MKLIDLLVKELPKRGGWPEGADFVVQDGRGGFVKFGAMPIEVSVGMLGDNSAWQGEWHYTYSKDFSLDEIACDWSSQILMRDQYETALAKNDGWIEWGGGECPVDGDTIVDVKRRDGEIFLNAKALVGKAENWNRGETEHPGDIIAYRPHHDINSRANDDRLEQDLNECIGQDVDMPEWNGEGLPPVGVECELKYATGEWVVVEITAIARNGVCFVERGKNGENYAPFRVEFRPLRTEAEMAREKLAASLHIAAGASPIELNGIGRLYFKLADAIISGSIFGTTFKAGK